MNRQIINIISITLILFIGTTKKSYSQKCGRDSFCDIESLDEYDFRAQSFDALLSPGDTSRIKFVAYSKQDFSVMVCGDPTLGDIHFRILQTIRKTRKIITDTIITAGEVEYEMDEDGYEVLDDNDDPIIISKEEDEIEYVYGTVVEKTELVVYDNHINTEEYWKQRIKKTKRLVVEIIIEDGDEENIACVNTLIGRKFTKSSKFHKK